MPKSHETRHSIYTPRQLYAMVADVEKYPEFIPWCRAARILRKESPTVFLAELLIHFKHFQESYVSRVTLTPPVDDASEAQIQAEMASGPFHHLLNRWRFIPRPDGTTFIDFHLDFEFRSKLMNALIGGMFAKAQQAMVEAFDSRADTLYGQKANIE